MSGCVPRHVAELPPWRQNLWNYRNRWQFLRRHYSLLDSILVYTGDAWTEIAYYYKKWKA